MQEGKHVSFEYGRYGNPTTRAVEKKLACVPSTPRRLALREPYQRPSGAETRAGRPGDALL